MERLSGIEMPVAALALLGLAALLAHTVCRRWLERSDSAFAPFVSALAVMSIAWVTAVIVRIIPPPDDAVLDDAVISVRIGTILLVVVFSFLWFRSPMAPLWRALRGNPRGVWLLGISIRAATGRAVGCALAGSVMAGIALGFAPDFSLDFWVVCLAALTLAVSAGFMASLITGPVLAAVALLAPFELAVAVAGLAVVFALAMVTLARTDSELA